MCRGWKSGWGFRCKGWVYGIDKDLQHEVDGLATVQLRRYKRTNWRLAVFCEWAIGSFLQADPQSLYKFLTTLKASTKDNKNVKLPVLSTVKRSEVQKVKTDLMIFGANEYLKAAASFPEGLQKLSVVNCRLVRFDLRILALRHLVELDLSKNRLKQLDFSLAPLKLLKTLNLSSNLLTSLPSKVCRTSKLVTLDLSYNKLACLPISFGAMESLVNVKLNNNCLTSLPSNIGLLTKLRCLNISTNQLILLPCSVVSELQMNTLDISRNNFLADEVDITHNFLCETLQERVAKVIWQRQLV